MTKALEEEWEPRGGDMVVTDDHGEIVLAANEWEANYSAGDMEWTFTTNSDENQADAQWIAELARPVLEDLYMRIGVERGRRIKAGLMDEKLWPATQEREDGNG